MKLAASCTLARRPWSIARAPSHELLLLTAGNDGAFLEAYDLDIELRWSMRLGGQPIELLLSADGTLWVLDQGGATALGDRGGHVARVDARMPDGMQVAAFALVDDDLCFACQHKIGGPICAPMLQRVARDGSVRWQTTLPLGSIAYKGVVQMRADEGWRPRPLDPWTPTAWVSLQRTLDVSGDAVLACFSDVPQSGIGMGFVLSLADGALRFATQQGPISETAPLGRGAFLVGYQGYGAFETLLYERDGDMQTRWASHGHYLVRETDVRVIEMMNVLPSKMDLARLLPEGAVMRGARLDGYYTSKPSLHADNTALFFRNGALLAARDLVIDERLKLGPADDRLLATPIVTDDMSAYFAFFGWRGASEPPKLVRVDN